MRLKAGRIWSRAALARQWQEGLLGMLMLLLDLGTGTTPEVCLLCKSSLSHTIWSWVLSHACVSFNSSPKLKKLQKGLYH